MIMNKIIYFIVITTILTACSLGPDYKRPEVNSPASFKYDSLNIDTISYLEWWDIFGDKNLKSLISIAIAENKDAKIAASRIQEASALLGFTAADQYPQLDITASGDRSKTNMINNDNIGNYFSLAPALSWELDFWGKFRRGTESARANMMASEWGYRKIMMTLISEVAATYFLLLDFKSKLEIAKSTQLSRKESLRIIQERFNEGTVAEIDLNQSQIQEAEAAAAVPRYRRAVIQTENALNVLLGRNPGAILSASDISSQSVPAEIPSGLPSSLLQRRPDIREAEQLLIAQNAQIGVAQALRFPAISISGTMGLASTDLSNFASGESLAWSVGGSLFGPLFNWGKNIRRVEIEEERTKQLIYNYERTVINAFREVEDALIEIDTYKDEMDAVAKQMNAAKNATELSRSRYDGGVTSYLEVLDSERTLFQTELSASQTYRFRLNSYIKLFKALGGGWITQEEMNKALQEDNN